MPGVIQHAHYCLGHNGRILLGMEAIFLEILRGKCLQRALGIEPGDGGNDLLLSGEELLFHPLGGK